MLWGWDSVLGDVRSKVKDFQKGGIWFELSLKDHFSCGKGDQNSTEEKQEA